MREAIRRLDSASGPPLLCLALFCAGCRKRSDPIPSSPPLPTAVVRVHTGQPTAHVATEDATGTVRAKTRVVLEARITGRIEQFGVTPGQQVKSGEWLAQLDAREIRARLD